MHLRENLWTFALVLYSDHSWANTANPALTQLQRIWNQYSKERILFFNIMRLREYEIIIHTIYSIFCGQKNRSCRSCWERQAALHSTQWQARSCRAALPMAHNTRLQVEYLRRNMTGYEMLHTCTIHVSPSSADGGESDYEEQQSHAPLISQLIAYT